MLFTAVHQPPHNCRVKVVPNGKLMPRNGTASTCHHRVLLLFHQLHAKKLSHRPSPKECAIGIVLQGRELRTTVHVHDMRGSPRALIQQSSAVDYFRRSAFKDSCVSINVVEESCPAVSSSFFFLVRASARGKCFWLILYGGYVFFVHGFESSGIC